MCCVQRLQLLFTLQSQVGITHLDTLELLSYEDKEDFKGWRDTVTTSLCSYISCRTATLDFFFDLAESKVAVFLCSILTSDGIPFCFGKNSFL